jgi:hypothetical protein
LAKRKPVDPWVERMARVGYATKGAVYFVIGALAAATALWAGGETTDTNGAIAAVLRQPFGTVLTMAVGGGLAAYAAWRVVQSLWDTEGHGSQAKGIGIRFGYFLSGLLHASLAFSAFKLVAGWTGDHRQGHRDWTAKLLEMPFGPFLVAIVGFGVGAFAFAQVCKAWRQKFKEQLKTEKMNGQQRRWVVRITQFGLSARGIVFLLVGWFFINAARKHDPNEAGGLAEALRTLENAPYGPALLGVVAAGLIAYGGYMFVEAGFHRIRSR